MQVTWAYFGHIERVPLVFLGLFRRHDLDFERPGGVFPVLDIVVQIPDGIVGVLGRQTISFGRRQILDALVSLREK